MIQGAFWGFASGVGMLIATRGDLSSWFLAIATVVGSVAGLDIYLTRRWRRLGRFRPIVQFVVACTGAAGLVSAVAALVGVISPQLAWSFTAFGAIESLVFGVGVFASASRLIA